MAEKTKKRNPFVPKGIKTDKELREHALNMPLVDPVDYSKPKKQKKTK